MSRAFTAQNFAASTSPGFQKRGVWFKKGDVPVGQMPTVSAGTAQFYGLIRWSDGSLKYARKLCRYGSFAASESRSYTLAAASGSFPAGSTAAVGNAGLVTALSGRDIKVTFANVTQIFQTNTDNYNPTYGPKGLNGSGAFVSVLRGPRLWLERTDLVWATVSRTRGAGRRSC